MSEKVILILADGMRPDAMTACGHPFVKQMMEEATYGMDLTPVEITPGHWVAPDPCAISLSDLAQLGIDIYQ